MTDSGSNARKGQYFWWDLIKFGGKYSLSIIGFRSSTLSSRKISMYLFYQNWVFRWRNIIHLNLTFKDRKGQKYTTSFFIWIVGFMWDIMIFEILCGINVGSYVKSLCVGR